MGTISWPVGCQALCCIRAAFLGSQHWEAKGEAEPAVQRPVTHRLNGIAGLCLGDLERYLFCSLANIERQTQH
jgi:hypothetical protein